MSFAEWCAGSGLSLSETELLRKIEEELDMDEIKEIEIDAGLYQRFAQKEDFHTACLEFRDLNVGEKVRIVETKDGVRTGAIIARTVSDKAKMIGDIAPIVGFKK